MNSGKLYCFLLLVGLTLATPTEDVVEESVKEEAANIIEAESEGTPTEAASVKCVTSKVCFSNDDCSGGSCLGIAVGKCNCGACASFVPCKEDSACGGLVGACNNQTGLCDCDLGFKTNGIKSIFSALTDLCNVKDCVPNTNTCFGLPCNNGICVCP